MKDVRIIAEVGSTHLSRKDLIKEGIERLADADVDAIKFQLFPNLEKYTKSGNVWLSPDLFYYAVEVARHNGMDISASVFGQDELEVLLKIDPKWVKFAYSKKEDEVGIRTVIHEGIEAIVSCDVMSDQRVPKHATKLFCIPSYPIYYPVRFEGIFPRFDGFSDHTMGFDITLDSVAQGAKIIEKHVKLVDSGCPDCAFALNVKDFGAMVSAIRRIDDYSILEPRGL